MGKNLSETIIQYYAEHYDLKYVNIRPNLISGFGLTKDNLVYDIVKSIIENKNAIVFGKVCIFVNILTQMILVHLSNLL